MSQATRLREHQQPPEIWLMIWKYVAVMNDKYYNVKPPGSWRHGIQPVPFHSNTDDLFLEDPQRREAKLAFAASYSTALAVYGPELYEHVVLITATATKFLLNCTVLTAGHSLTYIGRARWVKHIDLVLSDKECREVDWVSTQAAWSEFYSLETLTICYHPKEPAPLITYKAIATHLPESIQLLRLRPWGQADGLPPQFPQFLKMGAKGMIRHPRRDFWWSNSWAHQILAFQSVPNIHLHAVVYVVWPPYSMSAASNTFGPWTALIDGGRLNNISVTLFPPNEGLDIERAIKEIEGDDTFSQAKKYGYLPQDAQDLDDAVPEMCDVLAYNWTKGPDGCWMADMGGNIAREHARQYGNFGFQVACLHDQYMTWDWYKDTV